MGADNPSKAKYKSPSGRVSTFDYQDLEHSFATKAGVFENASGNGTYVQDNGITGLRAPMACIFHGKGFDKAAKYFMASLAEPGVGVLTHPVYDKDIYVKPVGDVSRADNFVSGFGEAVVTVQFYETTSLNIGKKSDIGSVFDEMQAVTAASFANKSKLATAPDRESFKNRLLRVINTIGTALKKASGGVSKATKGIENTGDSIARGIDTIVGSPLTIARQCQILIGEPRRQKDRIRDKLAAYGNLAQDIFSGTLEEPIRYSEDIINTFHLDRLTAQAIVGNYAMLSMETDEFMSRSDYFDQALSIVSLMDDYQAWHDANYSSIVLTSIDESEIDTGDGIEELLELLRLSSEYILSAADQAKTKFRIETITERTPLDLCFELYGTTHAETLDLFIQSNRIVGDEFFLIPKGREIVYFV